MNQALYRKWRPQRWDQVVGQEHVIQTLRNAVRAGRVAHAYLFAGPRGTGKTTTARLLAKAVNCLDEDVDNRPCDACEHCLAVDEGRFMDLIEIDAASNTSVDDVRDLRDKIHFAPNQGRYKVYIIDEVHMLSTAAFNALLKTLEEPPEHAIFVLATTEVHKIPATVLSRCQRHEFRRLPTKDIQRHLRTVVQGENLQADDDALLLIARQATGSLRDAISLLDQLASTGQPITLDLTQTVLGTATHQAVIQMVDAMVGMDAGRGLDVIHAALDAGSDARQLARQVVDYLRNVMMIKVGSGAQVEAGQEVRAQMARHAETLTPAQILVMIRAFNAAAAERYAWQPALPLEMAVVESIGALQPPAAVPVQTAPPQAAPAPRPQPTPQPVASAESPAEEPVSGFGMQEIRAQWRKLKEVIKHRNPRVDGLLNSCRSVQYRDGTLFLGYPSKILKEKMEKEENLADMRWALEQVYGRPIRVKCVLADSESVEQELPPGADPNGLLKTALDLGGKIVDSQ